MHPQIKVLYQDQDLLVVDKPAGMVSEAIGKDCLAHRLDKDTSGVLVVAKNEKALENLREQFRGREVKKEYLALVHGLVEDAGLIDAPIIRNPGIHNQFVVSEEGR